MQSALAKLADAEMIYARGIPPEATYQFKHALIQDAAYEALLKTQAARTASARCAHDHGEFPRSPKPIRKSSRGIGATRARRSPRSQRGKSRRPAYGRGAFKESDEAYRHALTISTPFPNRRSVTVANSNLPAHRRRC